MSHIGGRLSELELGVDTVVVVYVDVNVLLLRVNIIDLRQAIGDAF